MYNTPIARFVTRPGGQGLHYLTEFDTCTPDLIMGTLLSSGAHLLKSNCIYELVLNEMTGVLELREKGEANIGKRWGHNYYDIPSQLGNIMWLTKKEQLEVTNEN
jgi:hypothetical protein